MSKKKVKSNPVRVTLGRTGLSVSPICYGSWQLSPRFWGKVSQQASIKAMRLAFDLGVNFYDTAEAYGDGLSETVMGKALKPLPREEVVVATKVFMRTDLPLDKRYGDLSHDNILRACDGSLKRLGMDYIDLYQCHSFDPTADPSEVTHAMETLKRKGKIRAYGVSNWNPEQMRMGHVFGDFGSCQPPYSLINRGIETDVLPYCRANNIGVLVYSPLHKGLLTGKYKGTETFKDLRKDRADYTGERFKLICDRVADVGKIAKRNKLTTTQMVLATTLMHPAITCAITGIKTPDQIEEAAGAMGKTISRDDMMEVRRLLSLPKE